MSFETAPGGHAAFAVRRRPLLSYGLAAAAVAVAIGFRWLAHDWLERDTPFLTFFPAVVVAALAGGLRAGVAALVACTVAAWFFLLGEPLSWQIDGRAGFSLLSFFVLSGATVAGVSFVEAALMRVAAQARDQRALIDAVPNGIVIVNGQGDIIGVNSSACRVFGYESDELIGKPVEILVPPRVASIHAGLRSHFQRAPETRPMGAGRDLAARCKDGSEFPVEIGLNPIQWNGKPAILATITDITERKQHEERQAILSRELEHRVGNIFSVVLATIRRTLTKGRSAEEGAALLTDRVQMLAEAHALFSEAMFQNVSLGKLVELGAGGFRDHIVVSGPDVLVNDKAAQSLLFILHELTTNAVKHGGLSAPGGSVSIDRKVETVDGADFLVLEWKESGGPAPVPPTRRGFGSFILLETPKQFGGEAALDYAPGGLIWRLRVPLDRIR